MPQIPSYDQRVQPLDGASAIIAEPGVKNWEVKNDLISGWVGIDETWTYASASTITIPTGGASRYQKGDKVRLKQGAGYKYYYIVAVADTLLTVTGGTDYTVANAAITDIYISREGQPFGFPAYFNYAPLVTALAPMTVSSVDTNTNCRFSATREAIFFEHNLVVTLGGTASPSVFVAPPCTILAAGNNVFVSTINDTSATVGRGVIRADLSQLQHNRQDNGNWTLGAGKQVAGQGFFRY